eukprot:gnl/TRDRNA2_/TRDRNA2_125342_c0_seq2.p3 gnl/TRDRNA2_/TRDRNA2_125342_c0~~gnl/TRDRNA2_/TRDRNA2_125342_c0_seq2.p3  ORF type:complete len:139 (+),score=6.44 gnl/TRDRNA2_/TRDRNA2_125342_c0_seq2:976-1392(+)
MAISDLAQAQGITGDMDMETGACTTAEMAMVDTTIATTTGGITHQVVSTPGEGTHETMIGIEIDIVAMIEIGIAITVGQTPITETTIGDGMISRASDPTVAMIEIGTTGTAGMDLGIDVRHAVQHMRRTMQQSEKLSR